MLHDPPAWWERGEYRDTMKRENPPQIPDDKVRHPAGCSDPDWCRGNRTCWWDCKGIKSEKQKE